MLLQGTFDYAPNVDGARWLVEELAPAIRTKLPDLQIRIVGKTTGSVDTLAEPPLVTVVGKVPRMEPELARADLVVVPLRMGSGTRLKILEAFAHRVPVVSTPLGAEGLARTSTASTLFWPIDPTRSPRPARGFATISTSAVGSSTQPGACSRSATSRRWRGIGSKQVVGSLHYIRSNRISVNSPAGRRMTRSSCRVSGWSDVSNPQ